MMDAIPLASFDDRFTMRQFMDDFDAAGLIPTSLLRWELTGELAPDVAAVLRGR